MTLITISERTISQVSSNNMSRPSPLTDSTVALKIAALPTEYGTTQINQLFERGYQRYIVEGTPKSTDLIRDVERFGKAAMNETVRAETRHKPFVDDPGTLALVATLSAICVSTHSAFESLPRRNIQILYDIRELYMNNLASLLRDTSDSTIQQDIAEILYAKPDSPGDPHPGRVCTGITTHPDHGEQLFVEIPMVAASRRCIIRPTDLEDKQSLTDTSTPSANATILTEIADNHLYVPIGDFDSKYTQYVRGGFRRLLDLQEAQLTAAQKRWLTTNESTISDRINAFLESGHQERLWRNWDAGEQLIRTLQAAINAHDDDSIDSSTFFSASALYDLLQTYDPQTPWEERLINQISSPRSLGNRLAAHREHRRLEIQTNEPANTYRIKTTTETGSRQLDVTDLEDLFELPCLANLKERLQHEKPVRKDLYNLVRMIMWLPQYQDQPAETIVADIKSLFSQWPWYDEAITEYQVRYEYDRRIDGEKPLPMNCSNPDMQRYCIGQSICPYSIYGSLPFPDALYDQLESQSSTPVDF